MRFWTSLTVNVPKRIKRNFCRIRKRRGTMTEQGLRLPDSWSIRQQHRHSSVLDLWYSEMEPSPARGSWTSGPRCSCLCGGALPFGPLNGQLPSIHSGSRSAQVGQSRLLHQEINYANPAISVSSLGAQTSPHLLNSSAARVGFLEARIQKRCAILAL